jgi:hypothetical protein
MRETLSNYADDVPKTSSEGYAAFEAEEGGGYSTTAGNIVTTLFSEDELILGHPDAQDYRDIVVPMLQGEPQTDEPLFGGFGLTDENLEEWGVEEEDYHEVRRGMVHALERGLRGDVMGPMSAPGHISTEYDENWLDDA